MHRYGISRVVGGKKIAKFKDQMSVKDRFRSGEYC